jgi:hypothetical protein
MTRRPLVIGATLLVLAGNLLACSPGGSGSPTASPSAKANLQHMLEITRRYAQCARDHGHPNFPDPLIDVDEVVYPDIPGLNAKEITTELDQIPECKALMDQIQSLRTPAAPPSTEDLAKLRELAKCMREHGLNDWPDPKADGTFPISGTALETEGKSERFMSALDACKSIYDKRIATS